MSDTIVESGDKLHIMTRRLFDGDLRRHFAGEVTRVSDNLCEIKGYTFVYHQGVSEYLKRPELRTRIFSLGDAGHIVNKLPRDVDIGSLKYVVADGRLVISDMKGLALDVNEFGHLS